MHHIGTIIDFAIIVLKIGLIKKNILNCCIFLKKFLWDGFLHEK